MNDQATTFTVDATAPGTPITRSWELAVGSGDAWSLLRADLQAKLRRAVRECGFRYLRCHGVLSDQLQAVIRNRAGQIVYNWRLVDAAYDALLDLGLRPFVELGFMPTALASGTQSVFYYRANVTPPADYDAWRQFITALVSHWRDRYGADEIRRWYFEVWNEANLSSFWSGSKEESFRLYAETVRAIKGVDPALPVGGPATSRAEWLTDFLSYCREHGAPVDFVSTHVYPDDDEFEKVDPGYRAAFERGGYLEKVVADATAEVTKASPQGAGLPLHWTEWNSSWRWGRPIHDEPNQAAYICRVIHAVHAQVASFAFWTISDIFNEFPYPAASFVGGFGLITIDGLPKPGYHAYQLLHRLGDRELPAARQGAEAPDETCLDLWATRRAGAVQLLLSNYVPPGMEGMPLSERSVSVRLSGFGAATATEWRVDATHANGLAAWEAMGRPATPSRAQLAELAAAAALRPSGTVALAPDGAGGAELRVTLPPGGVAFYELAPERGTRK